MSSTNNLQDILASGEQFTRVFVTPMVDMVRKEMSTHVDEVKKALEQVQGFEGRITKLEGNQKKALIGWGAFAAGGAVTVSAGWSWIKGKLHLG